ncbi:DUF1127 domain-containing protein [Rhizobiales bacterium]|uniref:DUF1127 domain-containing protein n=1 Tax=Hongsoonwoonella zoysiae TaxID=2821844 RepID=UPI00155F603E|nr:DUF1127 domain-containing protein [Hongsoonwoonella zoysiae]NRG18057.1 DUF1127 domain-containing protein [Hongsoonwoonella zoysiae]
MGTIGTISLVQRFLGLVESLTCDPRIPSPLGFARSNTSYLFARYRKQLSRRDLAKLTDEQLADIGLGRADAEAEARKPFWM